MQVIFSDVFVLAGYIIAGTVFAALIGLTVLLLTGRGANLVAGFNTLPKEEKDKFNTKFLCKFMGIMLLFLNLLINAMIICIAFNENVAAIVFGTAFGAAVIFIIYYMNHSKKFRKDTPVQ